MLIKINRDDLVKQITEHRKQLHPNVPWTQSSFVEFTLPRNTGKTTAIMQQANKKDVIICGSGILTCHYRQKIGWKTSSIINIKEYCSIYRNDIPEVIDVKDCHILKGMSLVGSTAYGDSPVIWLDEIEPEHMDVVDKFVNSIIFQWGIKPVVISLRTISRIK